jgi:hypothetical protein
MATVFQDKKGMLMVEVVQQETTVTSQVYYKILKELHKTDNSEQKA